MFSELRPVGNRLLLKVSTMDKCALAPFKFIGFQSGTAALATALISARKSQPLIENPIVLLPAYTCPDVISACLFAKVKPKMVDFEPDSSLIDLNDLKIKIDDSCIAIIAINFLGIPERIDSIRSIIIDASPTSEQIFIIEDSAQGIPKNAVGEYWRGDIITCSFGRGKPLNLMGGGGILYDPKELNKSTQYFLSKLTPRDSSSEDNLFDSLVFKIKVKLFNLLSFPFFYYFLSKLPFLKLGATIFHPLNKLEAIQSSIKKQFNINYKQYRNRQSIRANYDNLFNTLNSIHYLSLPIRLKILNELPLLRYPILVKDRKIRELIYHDLSKSGLGVSKMYKQILPCVTGIEDSMFDEVTDYPNAGNFAASLLTLPIHQDVNEQHIAKMKVIFLKYM